ncbi:MAG TPA: DUF1501 domain-containing protein, partial [Pirellulales bacterium]|nr:DUF1501 domain-containing protein [Pirellulales bacterium]
MPVDRANSVALNRSAVGPASRAGLVDPAQFELPVPLGSRHPLDRRTCLRLGLSVLAGGRMVDMFGLAAQAAGSQPALARRPTSCIFVWLDGGPSHFETFDPKPDAPREIRGEFDSIATRIAGVRFSEHLGRLAAMNDRFTLVRSIRHTDSNHGAGIHYMLTGAPTRMPVGCNSYVSDHPSLGAVTARERPGPSGMPGYFALPEMPRSGGPNFLGARYAPFIVPDDPNRSDFRMHDVAPPQAVGLSRVERRRQLRSQLDRLPRVRDAAAADPARASDAFYEQSYQLMSSPAAQQAFDLEREPDSVRDAYGRTPLGQRALLARRLVEAGVPFITLFDGGWDSHVDIFPTLRDKLPPLDQALATLIDDLDTRGLLETTLVVALGEFGRAPKITQLPTGKFPGREHWPGAMSVLFAGCGTPRGLVLGATDRLGS